MLSRKLKIACSLAAAVLLACGSAQANLVNNGGFETGDFTGWDTSLDAQFDDVDTQQAFDGAYAAYFGGARSSIRQSLATVIGTSYKVSFWLQLEADVTGASVPNAFSFDFGTSAGSSLSDATAFTYQLFESTFVATDVLTDLTFRFSQGPAFWDLDAIQVDAVTVRVPEPGSLALLAVAGMGGFVATRRRKVANTSA